jgi:hypothetical protein
MAHFGNGQRKQDWHREGRDQAGCVNLHTNPGQVGSRQQDERNVPIPSDKTPHFVVIQTEIFAIFKIRLAVPPSSYCLHHLAQRGVRCSKNKVVALFAWVGYTAADEQEVPSIIFPPMQHGSDRPVEEPGAFAAFAHRKALPIAIREYERLDQCRFFPPAAMRCLEGNRLIAGHSQHIGELMVFQPGAQVQVAAIDRYPLPPNQWGSFPSRSARSSLSPVLASSGSGPTRGCWRLDTDPGPHTSPRADRVHDQ